MLKNILIVDDDEDDIEFLTQAITTFDPSVKCIPASNGEQALRILQDGSFLIPDLIFLDLNMPLMGGRQCLIRLKSSPKLSAIPVVIYTTSRLQEDEAETKQMGAMYFLTKPKRFSELKNAVHELLLKISQENKVL